MISLVEQAVFRPPDCPTHRDYKGWRAFRIEYGYECSCPEGLIWLPPGIDPDRVEEFLNGLLPPDREFWDMS